MQALLDYLEYGKTEKPGRYQQQLDLEALASAIENFKGGVVLVSHDQYFVERVAKEVLVIEGGVVKRLDSFAAYKKSIAKKLAAAA